MRQALFCWYGNLSMSQRKLVRVYTFSTTFDTAAKSNTIHEVLKKTYIKHTLWTFFWTQRICLEITAIAWHTYLSSKNMS